MEAQLTEAISTLGVLVASAVLGLVKRYTGALDAKLGRVVKPLQPVIVTVAGVVLPFVTDAIGLAPVDPAGVVAAPAAAVVAITLRELGARLRPRK